MKIEICNIDEVDILTVRYCDTSHQWCLISAVLNINIIVYICYAFAYYYCYWHSPFNKQNKYAQEKLEPVSIIYKVIFNLQS